MEQIVGLGPLTQFDAQAPTMTGTFTKHPNLTTYNALRPALAGNETNSATAPMAALSARQPLAKEDQVNEKTFQRGDLEEREGSRLDHAVPPVTRGAVPRTTDHRTTDPPHDGPRQADPHDRQPLRRPEAVVDAQAGSSDEPEGWWLNHDRSCRARAGRLSLPLVRGPDPPSRWASSPASWPSRAEAPTRRCGWRCTPRRRRRPVDDHGLTSCSRRAAAPRRALPMPVALAADQSERPMITLRSRAFRLVRR